MNPRAVVSDVKAEKRKGSLSATKKDLRSLTRLLAKVRDPYSSHRREAAGR